MHSLGLRIGSAIVGGLLAVLALGPAIAQACNEPRGYAGPNAGGPPSYGPDDPVPLKITGTDYGAQYSVTVDGSPVLNGEEIDGGAGETASFTMPDLGSTSREVAVDINVSHDGDTWPSQETLQYEAPAPPPGPSDTSTVPGEVASQPEPAPAADPPVTGGGHGEDAGESNGADRGPRDPSPASVETSPASVPAEVPSVTPVAPAAASPAASSAGVTAEQANEATAANQTARAAADVIDGSAAANVATVPRGPAIEEPVTLEREAGPVSVPTIGLAVVGLILLLGTAGLATVFFIAGRLAPRPDRIAVEVGEALDPDTIEAELQRIIVEETRRPVASG